MRRLSKSRWFVLFFGLLWASDLWAGGLVLPFRGARAMSHGGAFVVSADNLNAMWYNPATLFRSSSWIAATIDVGLIKLDGEYRRADNPLVIARDPAFANGFNTVKNSGGWFLDPAIAVGSNFTLKNFMFAFGVYGPYAGAKIKFPEDGPQRYSLIQSEPQIAYFQLSASWRPIKQFAIGVGLYLTNFSFRQDMKVSTYPGIFGWAEDQTLDALIRLKVKDNFNFGAIIGLWGSPIKGLELGFTYQTPMEISAKGTLKLQIPSNYFYEDTSIEGENVTFKTKLPQSIRAGIRYVMEGVFDVEVNYMWEQWSRHKSIVVSPSPKGSILFKNVPGIGDYLIKPFTIDEDFKDSHSVHIGASYVVWRPYLELRAGYFFETRTVPDRTMTVNTLNNHKHGITFGVSAHYWKFRLDISYAHIIIISRNVTTSEKRQVNPLYDEDTFQNYKDIEGLPTIVANGKYSMRYNIIAMALSFVY